MVTSLEAQLVTDEEVIVLRTITKEEATQEIRELYGQGGVYYISEVAERLSLPDDQVVSIIQELANEGEIQQHE